jgi:hypothetical protein
VRVKVGEQLREIWRQATGSGHGAGESAGAGVIEAAAEAGRRTLAMPAILNPVQFPGRLLPKPTPMNLRRFAETPVVRRAINVIKDRIAAMDWQVRVRRGREAGGFGRQRKASCGRCAGRWKNRMPRTASVR